MADAKSAPYSALKAGQIRLLSLQPAPFSHDIRCGLQVVKIDGRPQYEALSYVWGDPHIAKAIKLCGAPHQVTVNLESALRHLRFESGQRLLWIDALCVNQEDVTERGHQVSQMGHIYAYADRVLVWLGDATKQSDVAIDGIELLVSDPKVHWIQPAQARLSRRQSNYMSTETVLEGFVDIAIRPWWDRVWTVQEALLAKDLVFICGTKTLLSNHVKRFMDLYFEHVGTIAGPGCCGKLLAKMPENWIDLISELQPILVFRENIILEASGLPTLDRNTNHPEERARRLAMVQAIKWQEDATNLQDRYFGLLDLVAGYRARLCTDPRDRIYGFLSLSSELKGSLVPDYSIPCEHVYANFAFQVMREQDNLDLLTVLIPGQFESSTPTWAPDWRYKATADGIVLEPKSDDDMLYDRFNSLRYFDAAGSQPCMIDLPSDLVLSVEGCVCDEVKYLASYRLGMPYSKPETCRWFNILIDVYNIDCGDHVANMKTAIEACCGYPRATGALRWWSKRYLMYQNFLSDRSLKFRAAVKTIKRKFIPDSICDRWWRRKADVFDELIWMRKYSITEKDFVGFVPYQSQPGDKICILFGGHVPYVLRKIPGEVESGGKNYPKYIIIGDCYIHGLMHGEGVKMMESGELKRQKFFLY